MKKILLLIFILTVISASSVYAQKLDEPAVKYSDDELARKLIKGEYVSLTDMLWAEGGDIPMAMALDEIDSASYYDQLNDFEKTMYDNYDASAEKMMDGVSSVTTRIEVPVKGATAENVTEKLEEAAGIPLVKILSRPVYVYFYMDHPEAFWLDFNKVAYSISNVSISAGGSLVTLEATVKVNTGKNYKNYWPDCFTSQAQVEKDYTDMNKRVEEIISAVPENASDFYKAKYFIEWLCEHNTYNPNSSNSYRYKFIAPSALLYGDGNDTTKYPVCEGYAEALKILCDRAGIEAMCMTSTTHKWNALKLNGKFYFTDPTWCDSGNQKGIRRYSWLLIGMNKANSLDSGIDHNIVYQTILNSPSVSNTMYIEDIGLPVYPTNSQSYYYLDIDKNGTLDFNDAKELLSLAAGINTGAAQDMTGDGTINLNDVIKYMALIFK